MEKQLARSVFTVASGIALVGVCNFALTPDVFTLVGAVSGLAVQLIGAAAAIAIYSTAKKQV